MIDNPTKTIKHMHHVITTLYLPSANQYYSSFIRRQAFITLKENFRRNLTNNFNIIYRNLNALFALNENRLFRSKQNQNKSAKNCNWFHLIQVHGRVVTLRSYTIFVSQSVRMTLAIFQLWESLFRSRFLLF